MEWNRKISVEYFRTASTDKVFSQDSQQVLWIYPHCCFPEKALQHYRFIPQNKRIAWKSRVHGHHQKLGMSKPTASPPWQACEGNKYDSSLLLVSRTSWHKNIKQEIQSLLCLIPVISQDTCTKVLASVIQNCPGRCEGQRNGVAVVWHAPTQCALKGLFHRDGKKRGN